MHSDDARASSSSDHARIAGLVERLDLAEKAQMLTGRDFWTTWPVEKIGLRRMLMSDGPSGVRGEVWDERDPSLNLPSGTALAASWDPAIARRYGAVAAVEARRKGVDMVLGPTVNLHRSPLGGRHFEAFSEDPILTSDLAASYVAGVQGNGVAATPKHYIANDYETDRFTASTEVSARALRELYLLAFEKTVTEAHTWAIMSSYNAVNGVAATENELLENPLNSEWGFDGIVVSDWGAVRSVAAANASQDLEMPGPQGAWAQPLSPLCRPGRSPSLPSTARSTESSGSRRASALLRGSSRCRRHRRTSKMASRSRGKRPRRARSWSATTACSRSTRRLSRRLRSWDTMLTRPAPRAVAARRPSLSMW